MTLEILLEEESAEAALRKILEKCNIPKPKLITFQGKSDLLANLPSRLQAYKERMKREDIRLVVLIDRDSENCLKLKKKLECHAGDANITSLTKRKHNKPAGIANRIAIEELEAWFFGDLQALKKAYPEAAKHIPKNMSTRDPDQITSPFETLEKYLKKAKTNHGKIKIAQNIAGHMNIGNNRSESFKKFIQALHSITK